MGDIVDPERAGETVRVPRREPGGSRSQYRWTETALVEQLPMRVKSFGRLLPDLYIQCRGNADQILEDGDADRKNESGTVHQHDQSDPGHPTDGAVVVQVARIAEEADEEDLSRGVVVEGARDCDYW